MSDINESTPDKSAKLTTLLDHIEANYHASLYAAIPQIGAFADKVAQVHGRTDPRLVEVAQVFSTLGQEFSDHIKEEETVLFPTIRKLETEENTTSANDTNQTIEQMKSAHNRTEASLKRLHELTDGYSSPNWACNTYRTLMNGLKEFESHMLSQIKIENEIVFAKVAELKTGE